MNESHVDFMASQLRSFNIQTTPLMVATEVKTFLSFSRFVYCFLIDLYPFPVPVQLHKMKKLLDRIDEHLKPSMDDDVCCEQFRLILLVFTN